MGFLKKLFLITLVSLSLQAKAQITEPRWEIISSKNFDLYLPKSSEIDYYKLLSDAENHLAYCESLFDFHLYESIRLVLSRSENIVKIPVSLNNSKSTEVQFDRHTGYIVSSNSYEEILLQVKNSTTSILFNDLMYGKSFQEKVQNSALLQVPGWCVAGLTAYCSEPWLSKYDGAMREYSLQSRLKGFNALVEQNERLAGYSFWKFLSDAYGEQNIANVLYIAHLGRSIENGLYFVYGKSIPNLMLEWQNYYSDIYTQEFKDIKPVSGTLIEHSAGLENIAISPDGRWLAGVHYEEFKTKIYCLNIKTKSKTLINTSNGTNEVVLNWRNNGKINELLYKITETGAERIVFYNPLKRKNTRYLNIKDFDKLINFDIDTNGNYVFYGVKKSKTFLVYYSAKSQKMESIASSITIKDVKIFENTIYFAEGTNAANTIISFNGKFDTMLVLKPTEIFNFISIDDDFIVYSSNCKGINQIYRYSVKEKTIRALSDFTHHSEILSYSNLTNNCYYLKRKNTSWRTYMSHSIEIDTTDLPQAFYSLNPNGISINVSKATTDSVMVTAKDTTLEPNSKYYFLNGFREEVEKEFQHLLDSMKQSQKDNKISISVNKGYDLNFSTLKVSILQLDNTNFSNMLDIAPRNPNGLEYYSYYYYLKSELSLKDILNKYQIFGGFRLSTNIGGGNDVYLKVEKTYRQYTLQTSAYYFQKRFDTPERDVLKQQIQKVSLLYNYRYTNTTTLKAGMYVMPFSNTVLSTDRGGLVKPNLRTTIVNLNTEFQYNRIKRYADFLFRGVSIQVQPQAYYNSTTKNLNTLFKANVKYYKPVYRSIIWSNQLQLCVSGGADKVLSVLGGAENWMFTQYDELNQISRNENYQLRSFAGAVRGFKQNARNGTNSFCLNSELRIPLAGLLSRWPTDRNWYQNLLLIPFADLGSAWRGLNIFDKENNYTVRIIDNSNSARNIASVEVKNLRNPIIGSYGCGLNTRVLGYAFRFDVAYGIEDGQIKKPMYLLSFGTNF